MILEVLTDALAFVQNINAMLATLDVSQPPMSPLKSSAPSNMAPKFTALDVSQAPMSPLKPIALRNISPKLT